MTQITIQNTLRDPQRNKAVSLPWRCPGTEEIPTPAQCLVCGDAFCPHKPDSVHRAKKYYSMHPGEAPHWIKGGNYDDLP